MDAKHLTLLRELRDRGSVAAVATATYRTPSAISQQLRTAERDLGVRLVEPQGRGIRLTDEAELLAEAALDVESAIATAQSTLDEFRGEVSGEVSVAGLPSALEYVAPGVLVALRELPITVRFDDLDVTEERFEQLADDYDIVVAHSMHSSLSRRRGLVVRTVVREPLDIAVAVSHRWGRRRTIRANDVMGERWIAPPPGYPFRTLLEGMERMTGQQANVVQEVRDNRTVEALVAAGVGIALLARFTTSQNPELNLLHLRDVNSARHVFVMARRDRAARVAVRRVMDELIAAAPA
ncbi:LysR family transcriptional regulator [Demetria terragena]|uniref:LysR family transcriptional regulator n=1 Tax=Demetria terragena TaxID=63959 RepID=UPI00035D2948|nr:LysR family transcriptional regulator [Demetria terragena]